MFATGYGSVEGLVALLEANHVDTVISTIDLILGQMSELPSYKDVFYPHIPKDKFAAMFSIYGIFFESGALGLRPPRTMNDEYPDIKVHSVLGARGPSLERQVKGCGKISRELNKMKIPPHCS